MIILIIGATGMLGHYVVKEALKKNYIVRSASLSSNDIRIDITDDSAVSKMFNKATPDLVINCAAYVDLNYCEFNIDAAWALNARAVSIIAKECNKIGAKLVQISTDHYYNGDGNKQHSEDEKVSFVNEYAKTKYCAEVFAKNLDGSLILRTNILGFHPEKRYGFCDWAFDIILRNKKATLFSDAFVSSIDCMSFSKTMFELIEIGATGIYNVGCQEVFSKAVFVERLAGKLSASIANCSAGSIKALEVARGDSLGLSVEKVTKLLSKQQPLLDEVICNLITQYEDLRLNEL